MRAGMIVAALAAALWTAPAFGETITVAMGNVTYTPEKISARIGDTIVWINKDLVPHTATSKAGGFDSKGIQADKSWRYTIQTTGEFAYICTFHPTMKAMLRVKE